MNSIAAQKAQLRRELRAGRALLLPNQRRAKALRAAQHFLNLPRGHRARGVAVYLSTAQELDTTPLIAALHALRVPLVVPRVDPRCAGVMRMVALRPHTPLRKKRFSIPEPARTIRISRQPIDLVLMPLLGFDASGRRLGSGGGYYDRWLARLRPRPYRIGYAYSMQQVERLPVERWDQALDAVCTERGIRFFFAALSATGANAWATG